MSDVVTTVGSGRARELILSPQGFVCVRDIRTEHAHALADSVSLARAYARVYCVYLLAASVKCSHTVREKCFFEKCEREMCSIGYMMGTLVCILYSPSLSMSVITVRHYTGLTSVCNAYHGVIYCAPVGSVHFKYNPLDGCTFDT